ncbi:protein kinase domain-containing protein [Archangium gephyra]|uniref:protein kinase domain-containing protein n=1 Tax=Archangium gephyra TaxID=48 RepID=UPI003B7EF197
MAEVFLAKAAGPMGFEKTLVLKRILPHLAEETAFVEMFLSEAKLAAQLTHPHVVQIFDFGEANGTYFLAMEYIDGPSLRTLIKRASAQGLELPLAMCARLVSHACEGLAFAHDFTEPETGEALGLIHRDISPDNILLSKQGAVKVVDFGIAKAAGQAHKTASGVIKGKLSYMPPEQVRAESLDRRVDVYALGVVLYELLTGHKPFESESDVGLMRAILFQSPMPAVQFRPELPDSLRRILGRAIAKDREQRYPDCHAFQSDLEDFILSAGKPVTTQQIAQLIAQVPEPASLPGSPRSGPTPSVTPVHTPVPAEVRTDVTGSDAPRTVPLRKPQAEKTDVTAPDAPRTVELRKPQAEKTDVTAPDAPQTVKLYPPQAETTDVVASDAPQAVQQHPPQAETQDVAASDAPQTVKLYPPQAEKTEVAASDALQTVKLYPPQAEKTDVAAPDAPQAVQQHPPQAEKRKVAVSDAPQAVQLRKPQALKEVSPESPSERPAAPDIRPLPRVQRPSMEVLSAQRKPKESRRGGKWAVTLVACVLIAGGGGVVLWRKASSTPPPQKPAPMAKVAPSPATPPQDESSVQEASPDEPPASATPAPPTDGGSEVRPPEPLEGASAAAPQDAGVAPEDAPLQAAGQAPEPDTSKNERPSRPSVPGRSKRPSKVSSSMSVSKGLLEFRVRPYATVFLSGKLLGDTPMEPVALLEGHYTVKFVNESIPKTVIQSVRVVSGETTIVRVNLLEE